MKKYLISIENEGSERLTKFFAQEVFNAERYEFKKIGIKGAELTVKEYFNQAVAGHAKALTPSELGCTLSHLEALKDFLNSSEQYAVVFEDDAIQKQNFSLEQLEKELVQLDLKSGFLFSLGGIQLSFSEKVKGTFLLDSLFGNKVMVIHPYYYKNLSSTYAYILDRQMAKVLIEYHRPPRGCDHWEGLSSLKNVPNLYATYLFDHPETINYQGNSYIEQERLNMKININKNIKENFYFRLVNRLERSRLKRYNK